MPAILLTARELARRLDVSYETVLTWVRRGQIPNIRDGRNRLVFNLDAVVSHLRSHEIVALKDQEGGDR